MTEFTFFLQILEELVVTPSVSQNEKAVAQKVAEILMDMGYAPEIQPVGEAGANVICRIPGENGPTILLGGHIDTVSACAGWKHDPSRLTVEKNRAYGLGACDMKGGICALLTLLRRFAQSGEKPAGDILFAALADEERFSLGAEVFAESRPHADFCILAEPHYDEFVVGATGKILLELTVRGIGGHAAKPETGVNAVACMSRFLSALDQKYGELYRQGKTASYCPLHIWNAYPTYSLNIPDSCNLLLNKQLLPNESAEAFQTDIQAMFQEICPEAELLIERRRPYYPAYETDTTNRNFIRLHQLAEEKQGHAIPMVVNQSVSDGNVMEPILGIPTVVFGPKGVGCHQPDEYLELDSVIQYIDTLYAFLTPSS